MSGNPYSAFCDDFYVNMRLGSQLALPNGREQLLHYFERLGRDFPGMNRFRKTDAGEFNLEEDRANHAYRWASVEPKRLASGHVNPGSIEEALKLHTLVLGLAPHYLGISPLEIDYLDVPDQPEAIVNEFRTRLVDTKLFWDTYAADQFSRYLFQRHEGPDTRYTADTAHKLVEEANLFIDAAHKCELKMRQRSVPPTP